MEEGEARGGGGWAMADPWLDGLDWSKLRAGKSGRACKLIPKDRNLLFKLHGINVALLVIHDVSFILVSHLLRRCWSIKKLNLSAQSRSDK